MDNDRDPEISSRTGGSDIRFLIKYEKAPTVIFGSGSTEQMHAINEHVNISDLINAVKILILSIINWCK